MAALCSVRHDGGKNTVTVRLKVAHRTRSPFSHQHLPLVDFMGPAAEPVGSGLKLTLVLDSDEAFFSVVQEKHQKLPTCSCFYFGDIITCGLP